jgi:hypothetical protein
MIKAKPNTKEQLIYFLLNNLSLGSYDKKFLNNIQISNLIINKPLTTNQSDLLNKIVLRYAKQLAKLELSAYELIELPWTNQPIQSLPEYTEAFLTLGEDKLILRSPYKKEFIADLDSTELFGKWNREQRQWTFPLSGYTLKFLIHVTETHYGKVNYCDSLKSFINEINQFKDYKYWDPTLVCVNNSQLIYGINEPLYEATKHIELDFSLKTLSRLVQYGIKIDDSIITEYLNRYDADFVNFAIEDKLSVELGEESIINAINLLEVDYVVFGSGPAKVLQYFERLQTLLGDNVKVIDPELFYTKNTQDKFGIYFSSGMYTRDSHKVMYGKTLHVVNSKPIELI